MDRTRLIKDDDLRFLAKLFWFIGFIMGVLALALVQWLEGVF